MTLFKTDALASIFVPDDGSLLTIAFKTSKGSKVELEIPTVQARPIVQQIMGAVVNAETRSNLAKQGVFGGLNPTRTAVGATEDRQDVIVEFQIDGGIEYKFVLPANEALRLGQKIVAEAQRNTGALEPIKH